MKFLSLYLLLLIVLIAYFTLFCFKVVTSQLDFIKQPGKGIHQNQCQPFEILFEGLVRKLCDLATQP